MHNDLFSIGLLTVHGYGLMIGLGIVAALLLSWHRAKKKDWSQDTVTTLAIIALIFGFLGAKLLYIFAHFSEFKAAPVVTLGSEGFAVAGGLILGTAAVLFYCHRKKLASLGWTDLLLPGVALAQGLGRIGCHLAGCCFGKPTDAWWGVVFPIGSGAPAGISLWPVQLISAAALILLSALLLHLEKRSSIQKEGTITALYLLLYGAGRFAVEYLRNDPRGFVGFLSTSQFISLFMIAAGLILLSIRKRKA